MQPTTSGAQNAAKCSRPLLQARQENVGSEPSCQACAQLGGKLVDVGTQHIYIDVCVSIYGSLYFGSLPKIVRSATLSPDLAKPAWPGQARPALVRPGLASPGMAGPGLD